MHKHAHMTDRERERERQTHTHTHTHIRDVEASKDHSANQYAARGLISSSWQDYWENLLKGNPKENTVLTPLHSRH